mgnify:CR=1 FL=1|jgi:hypothetical protein
MIKIGLYYSIGIQIPEIIIEKVIRFYIVLGICKM